MSPRSAAVAAEDEEPRRHGVLGALAAALPDRAPRRDDERPLRVAEPAGRRRRGWQVGTVAGLLLFLALFAIAGAHTLIVQQQRHIDDVNGRIAAAEADAEALKVDLAELQSPERIVREAKDKLGMVQAPSPVYLQPRADDDARAAEVPATVPTTAPKATTSKGSATSSGGTSGAATTPTTKATTPTSKATTSTTKPSTSTTKATTPTTTARATTPTTSGAGR